MTSFSLSSFVCPHCRSRRSLPLFKVALKLPEEYWLLRCRRCESVVTHPPPDPRNLYQDYHHTYRAPDTGQRFPLPIDRLMKVWRYLRAYRITRLAAGGSILDVGCGQATELQILKKLGHDVSGLEYSADYAKKIKKHTGIPVYHGSLTRLALPAASFSVITILHSLEHIPNTKETLIAAKKLLKKGGFLVISVPNLESLEARLFRAHWFHLDIPRHLYHFSENYLRNYITSLGYTYVKVKHIAPEYDYYSFLQSCLNLVFNEQNLLYRILLREEKKTVADYLRIIKQLPVIVPLILFTIPATLLFWTIGESGTVELVFQKK